MAIFEHGSSNTLVLETYRRLQKFHINIHLFTLPSMRKKNQKVERLILKWLVIFISRILLISIRLIFVYVIFFCFTDHTINKSVFKHSDYNLS